MTVPVFLRRLLWWGLGISLLPVAGAVLVGGEGVLLGVLVGAGLGCLNLAAVSFLGGRVFSERSRRRNLWALALALKFALFLALVGWALWALPVEPVAVVVGLGGPVLGLVIVAVLLGHSEVREGPPGEGISEGRSS